MIRGACSPMVLKRFNPYQLDAGRELDALVHKHYFPEMAEVALPSYSTDTGLAETLLAKLQSKYGNKVLAGATKLRGKKWFARLDTGPSTSTEALGETKALAICRLAAVMASKL